VKIKKEEGNNRKFYGLALRANHDNLMVKIKEGGNNRNNTMVKIEEGGGNNRNNLMVKNSERPLKKK